MERLKNFLENVFFLEIAWKILWRHFFWKALALVSLVLVLGREHSCPWPREGLFSVGLSLASDLFCVLGLGLRALRPRLHFCVVVFSKKQQKRVVILKPYFSLRRFSKIQLQGCSYLWTAFLRIQYVVFVISMLDLSLCCNTAKILILNSVYCYLKVLVLLCQ